MTLTAEEERDVYASTLEACILSFEKLAESAKVKAQMLREVLADPETNSEES